MFLRLFFSSLIFLVVHSNCISQESSGTPKKDQSIKSKRKQYKADKKKWKEERRNKRAEEKKIREHHKRIQTKEVRKRMKRSKGKAVRNNAHQREPFLQRMFQKKQGRASKKPKEKTSKVKQ